MDLFRISVVTRKTEGDISYLVSSLDFSWRGPNRSEMWSTLSAGKSLKDVAPSFLYIWDFNLPFLGCRQFNFGLHPGRKVAKSFVVRDANITTISTSLGSLHYGEELESDFQL